MRADSAMPGDKVNGREVRSNFCDRWYANIKFTDGETVRFYRGQNVDIERREP